MQFIVCLWVCGFLLHASVCTSGIHVFCHVFSAKNCMILDSTFLVLQRVLVPGVRQRTLLSSVHASTVFLQGIVALGASFFNSAYL